MPEYKVIPRILLIWYCYESAQHRPTNIIVIFASTPSYCTGPEFSGKTCECTQSALTTTHMAITQGEEECSLYGRSLLRRMSME